MQLFFPVLESLSLLPSLAKQQQQQQRLRDATGCSALLRLLRVSSRTLCPALTARPIQPAETGGMLVWYERRTFQVLGLPFFGAVVCAVPALCSIYLSVPLCYWCGKHHLPPDRVCCTQQQQVWSGSEPPGEGLWQLRQHYSGVPHCRQKRRKPRVHYVPLNFFPTARFDMHSFVKSVSYFC